MKTHVIAAIICCVVTPTLATAQTATYQFSWQGAGGYSMKGAVQFAGTSGLNILTEQDVQCFEVFGFKDEAPVGSWFLGNLTPQTTWRLHFDVSQSSFLVVGDGVPMPQAWNMDGGGYNCGVDGFGFNLAGYAQDLCINNDLIEESQVPPPQPFPATQVENHGFSDPGCAGELMMSQLDLRPQGVAVAKQ